MTRCPTCGRRRRPRRMPAAGPTPLPLFEYANGRPVPGRSAASLVRIVLLDGCRDGGGLPRPALIIPGRRAPFVFPTIAAALAAQQHMEAAHAGR